MKHLFSSGEVMYKKNQKNLVEGLFTGEYLEYVNVESDTEFTCVGTLDEKKAVVFFSLMKSEFHDIKNRFSFKILMQSDLFISDWRSYTIKYTE